MTLDYYRRLSEIQQSPRTWLITGVAGFIGSHLAEYLLQLNQKGVGLDNFSTGYRDNLEDVLGSVAPAQRLRFKFMDGDVRDLDTCRQACQGVDYVLHQAAIGSVPRSIEDPVYTSSNNINGFLNMMVASRDAGVRRFVYAASSAAYGDHQSLPKGEEEIGRPLSPYALTKYVNELYAQVFKECYGFKSIGLRYFNIFGKRQDPQGAYAAVIPRGFAALSAGEPVYIFGNGETSRDFCYIDNCVQANILAATVQDQCALNKVYNVALGERTPLNELFFMVRELASRADNGCSRVEPVYMDFRAGDVRHSLADISRAKVLLGYLPVYSVRQGLELTAEWYCKASHVRSV